jgi:hypothetical protein
MDSEFSNVTDHAAEVAASGRWDAFNARIRETAAIANADNGWWVQLVGSLCSLTFSEYFAVKSAYENKMDPPLLAWRARNLLELAIWSKYCAKGRENARRLYEDAGRDSLELYDKVLAFGKAGHFTSEPPIDWSKPFEEARQQLYERARAEGINSLDERYMNVGSAAVDCGTGKHFALMNKMLSKFAHATAMRILSPRDEKLEEFQRTYFFRWGCMGFITAFNSLAGC